MKKITWEPIMNTFLNKKFRRKQYGRKCNFRYTYKTVETPRKIQLGPYDDKKIAKLQESRIY